MNKPISRLFTVSVLMFAALVGATSWWTVVRANSLNRDHPEENRRDLLRGLRIKRGTIRAADNTILARSVKDSQGVYSRRYPLGSLFGHPVGYSFTTTGQTGLEAFYNHDLSGRPGDADTLIGELTGKAKAGNNLATTLDTQAQRIATQAIANAGGKGGSAVAIDPRTGAVKVMVSVPGLNPDSVRTQSGLAAANKDNVRHPLVDRAVQFGYAPGSSFKVVTLSAAIDSGMYTLNSTVDGTNDVKISGVPLSNDFGKSFGQIDLKSALTQSVNTAFAQVAEKLGKATMKKYMERFGFDHKPQLDYPKNTMSPSGEYRNGKLLAPDSRFVDVGRMGIGQDKLQVTTMQMAQVAAAVANNGTLMKPHLGDRFVDSDGRTAKRIKPEVQSIVMTPQSAAQVRDAMVSVVQSGTGTKAQIPGITVAGKTGTAETETGQNTKNKLWFIAFAPAEAPRIAVAVTVEDVVGFGGDFAAPIAKQIMEELLK
jgi:peptidoglycan glycosyltransferase